MIDGTYDITAETPMGPKTGNTTEGIVHAAGRDFAFRGTRKGA